MLRRLVPSTLLVLVSMLSACGGTAVPAGTPGAGNSAGPAPSGNALTDLIAAANKEGKVKLYINSTATEQWVRNFEQAFNDTYGTKISIIGTPGGNFTSDTSKVVTETSAGQQPSWDIMTTTDAHYATLSKAGLLSKVDWVKLFGAPEKAMVFGGGGFTFSQQLVTPAYNTKLVQASELKAWDDLLDPKWAGKIGVNTATHHWGRLSLSWGDPKTTAFIEKLAAQKPKLGATPETAQRLELGEIAIAATNTSTFINQSKKKGAPVEAAAADPILLVYNMAGPIKGATNPNAATLLAGFLATKKGHDLYEEFSGESSVFVAGTAYNKLVEGKQYVAMTDDFLAGELDKRTEKYGKMLGFR
jgi:iron(III) transport system substrate-binding protein